MHRDEAKLRLVLLYVVSSVLLLKVLLFPAGQITPRCQQPIMRDPTGCAISFSPVKPLHNNEPRIRYS